MHFFQKSFNKLLKNWLNFKHTLTTFLSDSAKKKKISLAIVAYSLKYDMSIFVFDDDFGNLVGESGKESVIIEMEVDFEAYPLDCIINHAINTLT